MLAHLFPVRRASRLRRSLLVALRRVVEVLLTPASRRISGAVTLEIRAPSSFALNSANLIALPLLLGGGVAFKVYGIMAWRTGKAGLPQSAF